VGARQVGKTTLARQPGAGSGRPTTFFDLENADDLARLADWLSRAFMAWSSLMKYSASRSCSPSCECWRTTRESRRAFCCFAAPRRICLARARSRWRGGSPITNRAAFPSKKVGWRPASACGSGADCRGRSWPPPKRTAAGGAENSSAPSSSAICPSWENESLRPVVVLTAVFACFSSSGDYGWTGFSSRRSETASPSSSTSAPCGSVALLAT
jgi:hypothetical protein